MSTARASLPELVAGGSADLDEVMATMHAAFDPGFGEAWTRGQCSGILGLSGVWLLLARIDGRPAGFALARVVTKRAPTAEEMADLRFAWVVCKHVKSNAIVLASGGMVVGVGAGQMSRVDSVHMAGRKAGERASGSVLASDAFFPFRDNVDEAARLGVSAIVQPGGSMRDADSIAACDEKGLAMVFTGVRHFRH